MTSRAGIIPADLQNVCPLADSCTHLCRGNWPNMSELVHRASGKGLACTALDADAARPPSIDLRGGRSRLPTP